MQAESTSSAPTTDDRYRVITVRMSRELHERLKAAAHARRVSLNTLCVDELNGVSATGDRTPTVSPRHY
jgi:predicted HicB family RNase H-like nuclease